MVSFYHEENGKLAHSDQLDWAKHAVISREGRTWLRYDRKKMLFACPVRLAIPRMMSRALSLCSGFLPEQRMESTEFFRQRWRVWKDVPRPVADLIADKLGQQYTPLPTLLARNGAEYSL
jgi:hypothetical protein